MCCDKNYQHKFDEKLKERLFNAYKFSNHSNYKFNLLLRKGVYPYESMGDWKKFNERLSPEKEDFYSHLNMDDITDADYKHAKRVCKDFEVKNLLLADVFENFRNICLKIYELGPTKLVSAHGLA